MQAQIKKLTEKFVSDLMQIPLEDLAGMVTQPVKLRGLAALPFEERRAIARKAVATREAS